MRDPRRNAGPKGAEWSANTMNLTPSLAPVTTVYKPRSRPGACRDSPRWELGLAISSHEGR